MTTRRRFITRKERRRYYKTFELYHEVVGLTRFVSGRIDPIYFGLEASAPRNAGQMVEYTGHSFEYTLPEQTEENITMDLQLGRVGTDVKSKLKQVRREGKSNSQADVIIREYIEGELDAPVFALRLFVSAITITAQGVVVSLQLNNPAGLNISEIATIERFQGLEDNL